MNERPTYAAEGVASQLLTVYSGFFRPDVTDDELAYALTEVLALTANEIVTWYDPRPTGEE